jgi:hypothetical protein
MQNKYVNIMADSIQFHNTKLSGLGGKKSDTN